MDLDCIDPVVVVVPVLDDKRQMDHPNSLVDMHNLECDSKLCKWLVFRKYLNMDQRIDY